MKYIYIILFIVCSGFLSAQTYELSNQSKWNHLSNVDVSCSLELLKEDRYCISFSVSHKNIADIVHTMFVSYGVFHRKGNMYYLKDRLSGIEISLEQVKHSNFIVRKGFLFMENEYFFYAGRTDEYSDSFFSDVEIAKENTKKNEREFIYQKEKSSEPVPLRLGTYKNGRVSLFLDTEYHYKIHYLFSDYSPLISEGKWSKKGNELTLHDPILDHSFVALIKPDGLFMIRFPNELNPDWNYSPVENEMLPFIMR